MSTNDLPLDCPYCGSRERNVLRARVGELERIVWAVPTELPRDLGHTLAVWLSAWFKQSQAENFVSIDWCDPMTDEWFVVSATKRDAKSPATMLSEAESRVAELERDVAYEREQCAAAEAKLAEWEEREAACCPEDFGFPEVIASLRTKLADAEKHADALYRALVDLRLVCDMVERPAVEARVNAIFAAHAARRAGKEETR